MTSPKTRMQAQTQIFPTPPLNLAEATGQKHEVVHFPYRYLLSLSDSPTFKDSLSHHPWLLATTQTDSRQSSADSAYPVIEYVFDGPVL